MTANESWYSRGKAEAEKGIPFGERAVGIGIVVFSVLMVLYFAAHRTRSTGFFTATFGTLEMLMLYGLWGLLPESLRFLVQWISNDIARVLMVLGIIVYLGAAVYCPIAYGFIGKKRSAREKTPV